MSHYPPHITSHFDVKNLDTSSLYLDHLYGAFCFGCEFVDMCAQLVYGAQLTAQMSANLYAAREVGTF